MLQNERLNNFGESSWNPCRNQHGFSHLWDSLLDENQVWSFNPLKPNQTPTTIFSLLFFSLATIAFLTHSIHGEYLDHSKTSRNYGLDSIFCLVDGTDFEYDIHDYYELGSSNLLSIYITYELPFHFCQIDFLRGSAFCARSPRSPPNVIVQSWGPLNCSFSQDKPWQFKEKNVVANSESVELAHGLRS